MTGSSIWNSLKISNTSKTTRKMSFWLNFKQNSETAGDNYLKRILSEIGKWPIKKPSTVTGKDARTVHTNLFSIILPVKLNGPWIPGLKFHEIFHHVIFYHKNIATLFWRKSPKSHYELTQNFSNYVIKKKTSWWWTRPGVGGAPNADGVAGVPGLP